MAETSQKLFKMAHILVCAARKAYSRPKKRAWATNDGAHVTMDWPYNQRVYTQNTTKAVVCGLPILSCMAASVIGVGGGANRELELRGSYVEDLEITVYQTPQFA